MKKISVLLTIAILAGMASPVLAEDTLRLEGESYASSTAAVSVKGGKAYFTSGGSAIYSVNADAAGAYDMTVACSELLTETATDFYICVNGRAKLIPEQATKTGDNLYTFPEVNLKQGANAVEIIVDGDDMTGDGEVTAYIDYIDFEHKSSDFRPTRFNIDNFCLESSENITLGVLFSGYADGDRVFNYIVENIDGAPAKMGKFTISGGCDEGIIDLSGIANGWYTVTIYTCGFAEKTGLSANITVTDTVTEKTALATDFAGAQVVSGMGEFKMLEKNMINAGVTNARERTKITGGNAKMKNYARIFGNDGVEVTGMFDKTKRSEKDFAEDLLTVYDDAKQMAQSGCADEVYEIMNEADGGFANSTGDMYAAYFKAAAIGVADGMPTAKKGIAGFAWAPNMRFTEVLLQNEVLDYSDFYNHHMHTTYSPGYAIHELSGDNISAHREMKDAYSENLPMYMTEAGFNVADGRASQEALRQQARFFVTQLAQANSLGTDRVYFFTWPQYREGDKTFGVFDNSLMPKPVYAAVAATANSLGSAKILGALANLPEGAVGYMYNDGENDVYVVYSDKTARWQLRTVYDVEVTDFMGKTYTAYATSHNLANVEISPDPIFIKFNGESDEKNYYPRNTATKTAKPSEYGFGERIVLRQLWSGQNLSDAKTNGYTISGSRKVTVEAYNFNDDYALVDMTFAADGAFTLDKTSQTEVLIEPRKKATVELYVSPTADALPGERGCLKVTAEDKEYGGGFASVSVAEMRRDPSDAQKTQSVTLEYANDASSWEAKNHSSSATEAKISQEYKYAVVGKKGVKFKFTFPDGAGACYAYPCFYPTDSSVFKDTNGICFELEFAEDYALAKTDVFVYTPGNAYHLPAYLDITSGARTVYIGWNDFVKYNCSDELDATKITRISVGLNDAHGDIPQYTVRNIGAYTSNEAREETLLPVFENLTDGATYIKTGSARVVMPHKEYAEAFAVLNGKRYDGFAFEDGVMTIDLSGLERGEYTLQAVGKDVMNRVYTESVKFTVEGK